MSDAAVATGPSAGALLRQAREAAGLHVAALAVSLKVPVRKLEALEDDRYDQLTDAVFARALASSVCRTLKVDPQPVLARLPRTSAPRLVPDHEGIGAPFRAPGDAPAPGWTEYLKRPVTLAVGGLLVGAVVILMLPSFRSGEAPAATAPRQETAEVPMAQAVVIPAGTPSEPGTVTTPVPITLAATAAPGNTSASSRPAAPEAVPVVATPAAVGAPAAAPATPGTVAPTPAPAANVAPANGVVVFKASGPSWVEVTDRNGNVALRRLLAPGESAGASGALPLAVTVGSVSTTAVEVRGKPYNLAPVSRDNVARFEIK